MFFFTQTIDQIQSCYHGFQLPWWSCDVNVMNNNVGDAGILQFVWKFIKTIKCVDGSQSNTVNYHYSNITSWCLKSVASALFVQLFVHKRKDQSSSSLALCEGIEGNPPVSGGFPSQRASGAEKCFYAMTSWQCHVIEAWTQCWPRSVSPYGITRL